MISSKEGKNDLVPEPFFRSKASCSYYRCNRFGYIPFGIASIVCRAWLAPMITSAVPKFSAERDRERHCHGTFREFLIPPCTCNGTAARAFSRSYSSYKKFRTDLRGRSWKNIATSPHTTTAQDDFVSHGYVNSLSVLSKCSHSRAKTFLGNISPTGFRTSVTKQI